MEEVMDQENARLVEQVKQMISINDIANKVLLKPLQIALKKSWQSSPNESRSFNVSAKQPQKLQNSTNQLAKGLQIAVKKNSIQENKFDLIDFRELNTSDQSLSNYNKLLQLNLDNLISFLKPKTDSANMPLLVEDSKNLGICICMYNEQKMKLKDTLKGVEENLTSIVKSGVSCDNIFVVVIIDGIETMDKDMVEYFQEIERLSDAHIQQQASLDIVDVKKKISLQEELGEEIDALNINLVLFDNNELEERRRINFKNVYNHYMEIIKLRKKIEQMKINHPLFDHLPIIVKNIFIKKARQQYQKIQLQIGLNSPGSKSPTDEEVLHFSLNNIFRYRSIMISSLRQTEKYCEDFITSRQNLSYLASFRKKIRGYQEQAQEDHSKSQCSSFNQTFMNLFICVKYKNRGKLSSHEWFFNGFCKELQPKYTVLLDVGLRPRHDALYKMYNYLRENQEVGGVCGYMSLKLERLQEGDEVKAEEVDWLTSFMLHFVDIQRAQQVEYHLAHLIDKPFQSQFDFIHVLPGAFSAYNMSTLTEVNPNGHTLLKEYFKSIDQKIANNKITETKISVKDIVARVLLPESVYRCFNTVDPNSDEIMLENENIYLAQDRILCMGIHKNGKKMHYLPDAHAEVDPIKNVHAFMGQRRRWINGSMFAFNKVKTELKDSGKGYEVCLSFQMLYLSFLNALSYFSPAVFLFTVHLAMQVFKTDILEPYFTNSETRQLFDPFAYTIDFICFMLLGSMLFLSLFLSHNEPKFKPYIYAFSTIIGLFQLGIFTIFVVDLFRSLASNRQTFLQNSTESVQALPGGSLVLAVFRLLLVGSMGLSGVSVLLYIVCFKRMRILFQIIIGLPSSIFYSPTYLIILNIFSLCRIDDISWGTKGLNNQGNNKSSSLKKSWMVFKYIQVFKFWLWNMFLGATLVSFGESYTSRFFISLIILSIVLLSLLVKIIIGSFYLLQYVCFMQSPKEQPIGTSPVLRDISQLTNQILVQAQRNLLKMIEQGNSKGKRLFEMANPLTLGKACFIKKLTDNVIKIQNKARREQLQKVQQWSRQYLDTNHNDRYCRVVNQTLQSFKDSDFDHPSIRHTEQLPSFFLTQLYLDTSPAKTKREMQWSPQVETKRKINNQRKQQW